MYIPTFVYFTPFIVMILVVNNILKSHISTKGDKGN